MRRLTAPTPMATSPAQKFSGYHEWLGLDPAIARPDYYQLVALDPSERDADTIRAAADRAISKVRACRPGPRAAQWAALLDELKAAKDCLTNPGKRAEYDRKLREGIAATGRGGDAPDEQPKRRSGRQPAPQQSAPSGSAPSSSRPSKSKGRSPRSSDATSTGLDDNTIADWLDDEVDAPSDGASWPEQRAEPKPSEATGRPRAGETNKLAGQQEAAPKASRAPKPTSAPTSPRQSQQPDDERHGASATPQAAASAESQVPFSPMERELPLPDADEPTPKTSATGAAPETGRRKSAAATADSSAGQAPSTDAGAAEDELDPMAPFDPSLMSSSAAAGDASPGAVLPPTAE